MGKKKTYGKILQVEEDIKKELTLLSEKVAHNPFDKGQNRVCRTDRLK